MTAGAPPAAADGLVDGLVELLARGTPGQVRAEVARLAGPDPVAVLTDVIGPALVEVGRRWQTGWFGVADAQRATALAEVALEAAAAAGGPGPGEDGPAVVVAGAEGEWHVLGARLGAEVLAAAGWRVDLAGPAVPAEALGRYVAERRPEAVVVACTMASSLLGARRSVDAVQSAGVPVVLAGRAVTGVRAGALGAGGGGGGLGEVVGALRAVAGQPPRRDRRGVRPLPGEVAELLTRRPELVDRTLRRLGPAGRPAGRPALARLVDHLAAAHLVGDPSVYLGFVDWWLAEDPGRPFDDRTAGACLGHLARALRGHRAEGLAELAAARRGVRPGALDAPPPLSVRPDVA